ncbi:GntR family transcriptional regulator [Gordonia sp. X0973]|uniref:GntR family transcriptional regulator n=1 Tax=Gordonia sp. X0973 TaxID=2742602 RepID=UPI000F5347CB|nr:GntR family transcriptional regulator [Gordonia sp. X0973]QKT07695.1 GntR family transcriptional regulator [Gordonia sp. X0973]
MNNAGLRRTQLTDEVAGDLRTRILTGEIRPGAFIRLDDVANELGCSVTPVREALVTLRGEGLVRSAPHRGFIVEEISRHDIVDIFWMQSQLSARLAVHAARNASIDLGALTTIVDEFEEAVDRGDAEVVLDREYQFHRAIHLAANSRKLAWFLVAATKYTPYSLYVEDKEWGRQAVVSHRRLIGHLANGDAEAISAEIHNRFIDARERLIRELELRGFWDGSAADAEGVQARASAR